MTVSVGSSHTRVTESPVQLATLTPVGGGGGTVEGSTCQIHSVMNHSYPAALWRIRNYKPAIVKTVLPTSVGLFIRSTLLHWMSVLLRSVEAVTVREETKQFAPSLSLLAAKNDGPQVSASVAPHAPV